VISLFAMPAVLAAATLGVFAMTGNLRARRPSHV
jgi:hypothetical protein